MMHLPFAPDPSRHAPIDAGLRCAEVWKSPADGNERDEFEDELDGPINFRVTLPGTKGATLNFACRDKSSGVLLPSEPRLSSSDDDDEKKDCDEDGRVDPFFFERGFYLEAKTGFQPWPGSRLMVEALACATGRAMGAQMRRWRRRLARKDLTLLELGAGIGFVGGCLAAAGGNVLVTDLPVLVDHGIRPNLRRNGLELEEADATTLGERYAALVEGAGYAPVRIGEGWACPAILDWTKPLLEQLSKEAQSAVDGVVACDCLFLRKLIDPLLDLLSALFLSMKEPRLLFTYQRRHLGGVFIGLEELLPKMDSRGWRVECLAWRTISVEGDGENDLYLFEAVPALAEDPGCSAGGI